MRVLNPMSLLASVLLIGQAFSLSAAESPSLDVRSTDIVPASGHLVAREDIDPNSEKGKAILKEWKESTEGLKIAGICRVFYAREFGRDDENTCNPYCEKKGAKFGICISKQLQEDVEKGDPSWTKRDPWGARYWLAPCDCNTQAVEVLVTEIFDIVAQGLSQLGNIWCAMTLQIFSWVADAVSMVNPTGRVLKTVKEAVEIAKTVAENGGDKGQYKSTIGKICGLDNWPDMGIDRLWDPMTYAPDDYGVSFGCVKGKKCNKIEKPKDKPDIKEGDELPRDFPTNKEKERKEKEERERKEKEERERKEKEERERKEKEEREKSKTLSKATKTADPTTTTSSAPAETEYKCPFDYYTGDGAIADIDVFSDSDADAPKFVSSGQPTRRHARALHDSRSIVKRSSKPAFDMCAASGAYKLSVTKINHPSSGDLFDLQAKGSTFDAYGPKKFGANAKDDYEFGTVGKPKQKGKPPSNLPAGQFPWDYSEWFEAEHLLEHQTLVNFLQKLEALPALAAKQWDNPASDNWKKANTAGAAAQWGYCQYTHFWWSAKQIEIDHVEKGTNKRKKIGGLPMDIIIKNIPNSQYFKEEMTFLQSPTNNRKNKVMMPSGIKVDNEMKNSIAGHSNGKTPKYINGPKVFCGAKSTIMVGKYMAEPAANAIWKTQIERVGTWLDDVEQALVDLPLDTNFNAKKYEKMGLGNMWRRWVYDDTARIIKAMDDYLKDLDSEFTKHYITKIQNPDGKNKDKKYMDTMEVRAKAYTKAYADYKKAPWKNTLDAQWAAL